MKVASCELVERRNSNVVAKVSRSLRSHDEWRPRSSTNARAASSDPAPQGIRIAFVSRRSCTGHVVSPRKSQSDAMAAARDLSRSAPSSCMPRSKRGASGSKFELGLQQIAVKHKTPNVSTVLAKHAVQPLHNLERMTRHTLCGMQNVYPQIGGHAGQFSRHQQQQSPCQA